MLTGRFSCPMSVAALIFGLVGCATIPKVEGELIKQEDEQYAEFQLVNTTGKPFDYCYTAESVVDPNSRRLEGGIFRGYKPRSSILHVLHKRLEPGDRIGVLVVRDPDCLSKLDTSGKFVIVQEGRDHPLRDGIAFFNFGTGVAPPDDRWHRLDKVIVLEPK